MTKKILVATRHTQGQMPNDFCFCKEGENIRYPMFVCEDDDDGPCGCRRSFAGMESGKGTTTALVVAVGISQEQLDRYDYIVVEDPELTPSTVVGLRNGKLVRRGYLNRNPITIQ